MKPNRRKPTGVSRREFLATSALAGLFAALGGGCTTVCGRSRRYAINASTLRAYELGFLEQVRAVAASGFKGFEPWMKDVHAALADGTFAEAKRIADAAGLEFVNGIAFGRWADPDPAVRAEGLAETKKDMLALKRLGCPRIAASMFGVQKPGAPKLTADEIAERFKAVLALGDETGVQPLLEYWGHSVNLNTPAAALEVLAKAGREDTAILADVYHTYRGGGWFGDFAKLKASQLPVLHVNDFTFEKNRGELTDVDRVWPGDGKAPWKSIFAMLDAIGADPWLSIELFNPEYCRATPARTLAVGMDKFEGLREKNPIRLAAQMWSVNDIWKKDPAGAFRRLRALGYEGVQSFGFLAMDWKELGKMLDGEGLKIVDMPFYMKNVKPGEYERFLDFCRTFDIRFVFEPWYAPDKSVAEAEKGKAWRKHVAELVEVRAKFAADGLRCGYHNHQHEFRENYGGVRPMDMLRDAGFDFELDVGHIKLAANDPVAYLKGLAGRVPSIHAKPGGGLSVGGEGDANDWRGILSAASAVGCEWAVVECETRRNTFEDVEKSIAFLKANI